MVPAGYDQFFSATATVAGALIGLLFVAISVRPAAAARTAHITSRLRAVAGLSAFLDTLFLSLLALRPRADLGQTAIALAWVGIAAMALLGLLLVLHGRDRPGALLRGALLLLVQGFLYVLQLQDGLRLAADPLAVAQVDRLAVSVIVLFALGVARSWEFAGAHNPSLVGTLATLVGTPLAEPHTDEEPQPAATGEPRAPR